MLDLKYVVEHIEEVIQTLSNRNGDFTYLYEVVELSNKRKDIILSVEAKKALRNDASKKIGELKRQKMDATSILNEVAHLGDEIKVLDDELKSVEDKISWILAITPNIPHQSVPVGKDDSMNVEIKKVGTPRVFDFEVKDHIALGESLNILDFERAAKITGTRFVVDKGLGARLERSLIQFMMDLHAHEHGYTEIIPPYIVNEKSMFATGQFPKFREDAFKVVAGDNSWYLNPTAEVPTINLHRDEILDGDQLPIQYCSYTTAFRSEAGSAGRDTRGILRQHQFNKVELIKFTKPEDSYQELEKMLINSEEVLKRLGLPYRVVCLSTGDMGFGMAKTYDIEVWLPGQNMYREIGSISNAEDYQARRANIRFKRSKDAKTEFVHTLNGSGLAVGRTMIAIIENYQNADGTITVPEALRPYMKVDVIK
ncbi:MAG: serine--tRNA ligase [Tenericutes bacterium GWC2_34_14]|nr:MAG: serine--tRNA ligase [Tenericutes bacterium GWA2_35_7]OHE28064.1 MAG: serine--tRNA ligase [Tenericutes bacterium GWC2_34_14]OHE32995.1 MAG: serine--tRNA ligase [Tenericutes bacterium GWE2_34_108]OHE36039.1 MAG: serine--tRNA ligase [Tenericutes bacterium GWF1_35_14]OHE39262.1 MAG: serine--tRNA ligase [Tenericutes bacterium GWF2_35_184]OHE44537.1 MAG: serine--tRNA ligase [Tenericutes bacterium RIFOXYA2_FULL_36_32]OHE46952.1 MAG: serine--tRNA ligase [Tenericutes bacterium RIFOXYA12_FULL_3